MAQRQKHTLPGLIVALSLLMLAACTQAGPIQADNRTIELDTATAIQADIAMAAGQLAISGGAAPDTALDATFTYNREAWQPDIVYSVDEQGTGLLDVQQPQEISIPSENIRYEWSLQFNEQVPLDLAVSLGAGESILDLSRLNLNTFDLAMGAGNAEVNLRNLQQDLDASIQGGVGSLTVQLPDDIGVRVEVSGGLGQVTATGLIQEGDVLVNEAYGSSEQTLNLNIFGGVGEITLAATE